MRSITLAVLEKLRSDAFDAIDLITIQVLGSDSSASVNLCSGGVSTTVGSTIYLPANLAIGQTDERLITDSGGVPSVNVAVSNINTDLAAILNRVELEDSLVTIRQCDRRLSTNTADSWVITTGRLRDANLTRQVFAFTVVNILGELEKLVIPKRYWGPKCSVRFGSPACGVDLLASPNTIETTCQTDSRKNYAVLPASVLVDAGSPADPTDYWANGYLIMVDGDIATQIRPIHSYALVGTEHRFYVRFPFLQQPDAGDGILLQRGCRHTKDDCNDRQGNMLNYEGFEEVPYGLIKPTILGNVPEV